MINREQLEADLHHIGRKHQLPFAVVVYNDGDQMCYLAAFPEELKSLVTVIVEAAKDGVAAAQDKVSAEVKALVEKGLAKEL